MKLLFFRANLPEEKYRKDIMWDNNNVTTDMWEQLAFNLGRDTTIIYWGGKRNVTYRSFILPGECKVKWINSIKEIEFIKEPDVIFHRAGHVQAAYNYIKRSKAIKIYYGSGSNKMIPKINLGYDIVLCDTKKQKKLLEQKRYNGVIWNKPASNIFRKIHCKKEFDICFIGHEKHPTYKGIDFVYKTAPKELKILHLGSTNKNAPNNVTTMKVKHNEMPMWINKCKVGIVPYGKKDSAPRVIAEMMACDLPIFTFKSVNFREVDNVVVKIKKSEYWRYIERYLRGDKRKFVAGKICLWYEEYYSINSAVKLLKDLITRAKNEKRKTNVSKTC